MQHLFHVRLTVWSSVNIETTLTNSWLNQSTAQPRHWSSSCLFTNDDNHPTDSTNNNDHQLTLPTTTTTNWCYKQQWSPTDSTNIDDHQLSSPLTTIPLVVSLIPTVNTSTDCNLSTKINCHLLLCYNLTFVIFIVLWLLTNQMQKSNLWGRHSYWPYNNYTCLMSNQEFYSGSKIFSDHYSCSTLWFIHSSFVNQEILCLLVRSTEDIPCYFRLRTTA